MTQEALIVIAVATLLGTAVLTATSAALRRLHAKLATRTLDALGVLFFYRPLQRLFFRDREYEVLLFATAFAQNITRLCYSAAAIVFLLRSPELAIGAQAPVFSGVVLIAFIVVSLFVADFLPRIWGNHNPIGTLRVCSFWTSLFLTLCFPISFLFMRMSHQYVSNRKEETPERASQVMFEAIEDAVAKYHLEPQEQKLIESVVDFRDRIAREIMVPRVDVFALPSDMNIAEAADILQREGYSRIPVYRDTVDNIVGVLMYKDVLARFCQAFKKQDWSIVKASIESLLKPVLYTPETKKISRLLQEFRKKQVHLAIVVDEYGGTEGIITIEDILEEIVGEIADEYDKEESPFQPLPTGGWIVDAHMTILDVEEQLGVKIPQEGEYDSISGYIFHRTGTIPQKGFVIEHDDFRIEIVESSDRCVEKVKLTPTFLAKDITGE